jgi:hypothetical protein
MSDGGPPPFVMLQWMPELLERLPLYAGVAFALLVIWLVVRWVEKWKGIAPRKAGPDQSADTPLPYTRASALLSAGEADFYAQLRLALPVVRARLNKAQEPLLFAKVRFGDLVQVDGAVLTPSQRTSALNRVQQKHADFVLCEPQSTRPLLVIELDDRSHERPDRAARDSFLDAVCRAAALPLVRVRAASAYSPTSLAEQLVTALAAR